jgi:flagellar biosynthetic protein FliR
MTAMLVVALFLVLLRVAAFVAFLPPFNGSNVPHTVKVGLAISLTALWCGKLAPGIAVELSAATADGWLLLGWLAARETLLGAAIGWFLGLVLVPIRIAGAYIVQEMGLTIAAITDPTEGSESNILSQLLEIAAVLFLFGANLHHEFFRLLDASWALFPAGRAWRLPGRDWFIDSLASTSELGLSIAAPVGVVLFVALIATLFIMRQNPHFNLFTFGMPVRLIVGLGALVWFLPSIFTGMATTLQHFVSFRGF